VDVWGKISKSLISQGVSPPSRWSSVLHQDVMHRAKKVVALCQPADLSLANHIHCLLSAMVRNAPSWRLAGMRSLTNRWPCSRTSIEYALADIGRRSSSPLDLSSPIARG
jgi:hypothetical protein